MKNMYFQNILERKQIKLTRSLTAKKYKTKQKMTSIRQDADADAQAKYSVKIPNTIVDKI